MLDTKIARARENIDSVGMEFAYGKCRAKRPKREAAGGGGSGKRGFSELTVVFRNMLVHFNTGG